MRVPFHEHTRGSTLEGSTTQWKNHVGTCTTMPCPEPSTPQWREGSLPGGSPGRQSELPGRTSLGVATHDKIDAKLENNSAIYHIRYCANRMRGGKRVWRVARSCYDCEFANPRPYALQIGAYGTPRYTVMCMSDRLLIQASPPIRCT